MKKSVNYYINNKKYNKAGIIELYLMESGAPEWFIRFGWGLTATAIASALAVIDWRYNTSITQDIVQNELTVQITLIANAFIIALCISGVITKHFMQMQEQLGPLNEGNIQVIYSNADSSSRMTICTAVISSGLIFLNFIFNENYLIPNMLTFYYFLDKMGWGFMAVIITSSLRTKKVVDDFMKESNGK